MPEPIIVASMRILVLTNMYPPHSYGGYEQSCRDVVERWRAAGHEVLVLTSTVRVPEVDEGPERPQEVRRVLRIYWADHEILDPPPPVRYRMERSNQRALDAALEEFAPDVVSAWAMGAMSLGALGAVARRGLPVVSVVCDDWPCYGPTVDAWMRPLRTHRRLARVVRLLTGLEVDLPPLDRAGTGCFVSQFLLDAVRERSPWSFPDATVVYSGIKAEEFPFAPSGTDPFGWRLLYVGRIDPRKGIETVVRALARCPERPRSPSSDPVTTVTSKSCKPWRHRWASRSGCASRSCPAPSWPVSCTGPTPWYSPRCGTSPSAWCRWRRCRAGCRSWGLPLAGRPSSSPMG